MGRSNNSDQHSFADVFTRNGLTPRARALQFGTPKALPLGESQAVYALLSNNTSSAQGGAAFYDKYFQPVRAAFYQSTSSYDSKGNLQFNGNGDSQTQASLFSSVGATQTYPSTSGTTNFLNATNAAGEFGNAMVDTFSNSTIVSAYNRGDNHYTNKHYLNTSFVDSDHTDQSIAYINVGQVLRAVSRIHGDYRYNMIGTKHATLTDLHTTGYGAMSYNAVRKELVGITYTGASGAMKVTTWTGVDFNQYPSPHIAMAQPGIVKKTYTIASLASWGVNNNESYYRSKPTLCDDGTIFLTVMFTSSSFALYKLVRTSDTVITPTYVGGRSLTTSYGADQDASAYGQRKMQSRDGGAVLCFCPYYYYGAGIATWLIDKRKSVSVNATWMQKTDSNYGVIPVPYGDSGFAMYWASNVYASNYTGGYIMGAVERDGDFDLVQMASAMYLPYFTMPNTTNYPGFTQVVDYSMLVNQNLI